MTNIATIQYASFVLMALVFLWSGSGKVRQPQPLSGMLNAHGYAISPAVVRLCGVAEIVAAILLVVGVLVWAVCLALAAFVFIANIMVNNFWAKTGMDAAQAKQRAIPSAGMVVGLLAMAAMAYPTA